MPTQYWAWTLRADLNVGTRRYPPAMVAKLTVGAWTPPPGSLPAHAEHDKVYVIPTRTPRDGADDLPRYTEKARYLPKEARAAGLPVEFSMPEGSRKYLQEFSIDPEMWALGLAVLAITNDWLIFTVEKFIEVRARSQGWTRGEAEELPLKISIVKLDKHGGRSETYEIEGSGTDVIDALQTLRELEAGKDKRALEQQPKKDHRKTKHRKTKKEKGGQ